MRLIDRFSEIFSYTEYLTKNMKSGQVQVELEKLITDYTALFEPLEADMGSDEKLASSMFAVSAWVDEKILCSGWDEAHKWVIHQLQRKFFNTTNAGEEFFNRLDELAEEDKEVREVFAYCLSLGFSGMYFSKENRDRLSDIKKRNFGIITENEDSEVPEKLFPDSQGIIDHSGRKRHYGSTGFTLLAFLLPPAVFIGLYFAYLLSLDKIMQNYFGF